MKIRLITVIIIGLCTLSIIIGLLNNARKPVTPQPAPTSKRSPIFNTLSHSGSKIALIRLNGVIAPEDAGGFFRDFTSAESVLKTLKKAEDDPTVKGILLRINSPGGTVALSQEIYNAVKQLRKTKPVVVSMGDVTASGGYYIACAADRIYANPGTLTGSIGVIMETVNAKGLLTDRLGIQSEVIKSGRFKDAGSIYRPLSDDEKALLNTLVNNTYNQFLQAIIDGRVNRNDSYKLEKINLTRETLKKYADGRIFSGEQALQYGFIDNIGGLAEAEEGIKKIVKKRMPVVEYNRPTGFEDFFMQVSNKWIPQIGDMGSIIPLSRKYPRQPLLIWE